MEIHKPILLTPENIGKHGYIGSGLWKNGSQIELERIDEIGEYDHVKSRSIKIYIVACLCGLSAMSYGQDKPGYRDTPKIPGQDWHVHDPDRPQPNVVRAGDKFSEMASAPSDAIVLFDGTSLDKWTGGEWLVKDGYMEVTRGGISTEVPWEDFQIHIEWATPAIVKGDSQGRGNSGLFLPGRHEIQILDSYENPTYPDGSAGSMYGQWPPRVNVTRAPGQWQTYDVIWEAPRWDDNGKLKSPGFVTVIHNGVLLHHRKAYNGPTGHKQATDYSRVNKSRSISLQDHGNPTKFRNIWVRPIDAYDE